MYQIIFVWLWFIILWNGSLVTCIEYIQFLSLFFQQMLKERMICHASGDVSHPFIVGFYLYHIVQQEKDQKGYFSFILLWSLIS